MSKVVQWTVAGGVLLASAIGMLHAVPLGARIALVVLAGLLVVVLASGPGFVIVIYRKRKPRKRTLTPAPDPALTHQTRTRVESVTVLPLEQARARQPIDRA